MKLFTFCSFFLSFFSLSQTSVFTGSVKDAITFEPISFASIRIQPMGGVMTDINGNFSCNVGSGSFKIIIRQVGYQTLDTTLKIGINDTVIWHLLMQPGKLEEVVVAAGKFEQNIEDVSVSMNILQPDLIENKATTDMEDIMKQVPGLTVQDGQVSIRGGSGFAYGAGSRVLVLVDELPILSADAGDVKWNALPVENVQQVEVIKGASSVLYGSSALNGVVNIRTKYPGIKPETRVNIQHGLYDSPKRAEIQWWEDSPSFVGGNFYHLNQINKNFDLVLGGNFLSSTGYRQGENEERIRFNANTRFRSEKITGLNYGLNTNIQFARTGLFVLWKSAASPYVPAGGAGVTNPNTTLTFQDGWRINVDPYIQYFNKKGDQHSLRTRWYRTNNENQQGRGALGDLCYAEYQFQTYFDSAKLNLTTGINAYTNTVKSDLYGDHNGENVAFFSQLDKKWKKFTFNAGLRFEYFKLDSSKTTYQLGNTELPVQPVFRTGVTYKLFKHSILRASWGQGYRFPSIAEKYASTNIGAVTIFPNPELKPERGWSAELGIKQVVKLGKAWLAYVDVAGFWTEYQNMIEFTFDDFVPPGVVPQINDPNGPNYLYNLVGFQARNAENARITGLDLSIAGRGELYKGWGLNIFGGYTYMNPITLNSDSSYLTTFSDTGSTMLKFRYNHLIKGDVQLDYKKWSFGLSARYNSFMKNIDATFLNLVITLGNNQVSLGDQVMPGLPGYRKEHNDGDLMIDTRISYEVNSNAKFAFLINNITNSENMGRPGDVLAPRTFAGQITLNF